MTIYHLAVLSCRVLALYILTQFLQGSGGLLLRGIGLPIMVSVPPQPSLIQSFQSLLLQAAIAFILWRLAPWLGRRMARDLEAPDATLPYSPSLVAGLVFSLAGVIILGIAFPQLIQRTIEYWSALDFQPGIWHNRFALLIPPLVQVGLGLWLMLTSHGLVRLLEERYVDDEEDEESDFV
jgi:hypothetical protein